MNLMFPLSIVGGMARTQNRDRKGIIVLPVRVVDCRFEQESRLAIDRAGSSERGRVAARNQTRDGRAVHIGAPIPGIQIAEA
jgi:hypothetical protein